MTSSKSQLWTWIVLAAMGASLEQAIQAGVNPRQRILANSWNLPLSFENPLPNTNSTAAIEGRGLGYTLRLNSDGALIQLEPRAGPPARLSGSGSPGADPAALSATLHVELLGAKHGAAGALLDPLPGRSSYFLGNDPTQWRTNVLSFARAKFEEVYPGIDWVCYGNQRQFEYDFCLRPGAHPEQIALRFIGAERLEVEPRSGDLVVHTAAGELRQPPPRVYQEINGRQRAWPGSYYIRDTQTVAFRVGQYNAAQPLVIDPALVYSALVGRTNELDNPWGLALDSGGNAYVTGSAVQTNQTPHVYVLKLDATGTNLVYSALIGGTGGELPGSIAVDASGAAYLTGTTKSTDFPRVQALQSTLRGPSDAFVCKIDPTGTAFVYSTYLGGDASFLGTSGGEDGGFGIAVDSAGSAYVAGTTTSTDIFGPGSKRIQRTASSSTRLQPSLNGPSDAFVAKFAPDGLSLIYGTYLGGSSYEAALAIALDSQNNACIFGMTKSSDFPALNAQQSQAGGGFSDAFVTKLNATGTALLFSTYIGGSGEELPSSHSGLSAGAGIAIDLSDNIYVVGDTYSGDFPLKNPIQSSLRGPTDGFVCKFTPQGALVYSTYLGGSNQDAAFGVAVDAAGNAYVTGGTQSTDFPTMAPFQSGLSGSVGAFVSVLNPAGSALLFSTYLGADGVSSANGIAVDSAGNAYLAGLTTSTNFPDTGRKTSALRTTFVTKLSIGLAPPPPVAKLFKSFGWNANHAFVLSIQGQPNHAYSLDFSTDLKQWVPLTQFNSPDGTLEYLDSRASLFPNGFYRVR